MIVHERYNERYKGLLKKVVDEYSYNFWIRKDKEQSVYCIFELIQILNVGIQFLSLLCLLFIPMRRIILRIFYSFKKCEEGN